MKAGAAYSLTITLGMFASVIMMMVTSLTRNPEEDFDILNFVVRSFWPLALTILVIVPSMAMGRRLK